MAIRTRNDVFPYNTGINTKLLTRASKLVSAVSAFPVQYNKAIVGKTLSPMNLGFIRMAC